MSLKHYKAFYSLFSLTLIFPEVPFRVSIDLKWKVWFRESEGKNTRKAEKQKQKANSKKVVNNRLKFLDQRELV